jgi:hypothetical protein
MFGKKNETNDRYIEGMSTVEAKAYTRIIDVLETHPAQEDAYAVLMAVKILCEYELRGNPYARNVMLFKREKRDYDI